MATALPIKPRRGRPPDLRRRAVQLARAHGATWLNDLARQADLGDPAAIRTILDLAAGDRPRPPSRPDAA